MDADHTPGPWRVGAIVQVNGRNVGCHHCVLADWDNALGFWRVGGVGNGISEAPEVEARILADAHLIAAAPDMLEELEQQADGCSTIISLLAGQTGPVASSLVGMLKFQEANARAAITKARAA